MNASPERPERRYGGQSAEERRVERQRRLLAAGLERYGTQGFRVTTVSDLCRTAGVAPIHFYEEYAGREALLEAVYDEIMATTRAEVDAALARAGTDLRARSLAGLEAFCHALLDDPRRARVQCLEVVGVSPAMEARRQQGLLRCATMLVDSFVLSTAETGSAEVATGLWPVADGAGGGRAIDALPALRTLAVALVGGVNEALIDWLLEPAGRPISSLVDALSDLFIATGEYLSGPTW
jgi:AcrR family transcriptional regulator